MSVMYEMIDEQSKVFTTLNGLNVNEHTEKKNNLTYLSWAWAWAEVKKAYPDAEYGIVKQDNGLPYVYDENTGYMVFTWVTIRGLTHEMWLPVMDGANKAMKSEPYEYKVKNPYFKNAKQAADGKYYDNYGNEQEEYQLKTCDAATMFDINKTIMRCLTKNLAMFGLGLYIYAGEDLPEVETENKPSPVDDGEKPAPVICPRCGRQILRQKGKDGKMHEPEEILEACGGICPDCYKEAKNEGQNS